MIFHININQTKFIGPTVNGTKMKMARPAGRDTHKFIYAARRIGGETERHPQPGPIASVSTIVRLARRHGETFRPELPARQRYLAEHPTAIAVSGAWTAASIPVATHTRLAS